ncbi:MAG: hypothetical protein AAF715_03805 [Myxococcota bacterium]
MPRFPDPRSLPRVRPERASSSSSSWAPLIGFAVVLLNGLTGCAGHEARVRDALDALDRGEPEAAVVALNEALDVETKDEAPPLEGDNALLLLDRATVLQSVDDYTASQRDFERADKGIELLDFSQSAVDDLGRYLFSDDAGPYRAPAFEKLLINTFNMMNYLARDDLQGARVEARRLAVMQKFLADQGEETRLLGLGSYLAGYTYERSGRVNEALRAYEEALTFDDHPSLQTPLLRLTGGRPGEEGRRPRIDALITAAGPSSSSSAMSPDGTAEVLVVVGYGRVPAREPVRLPIGLALTAVSGIISPYDRARANELAAKGLVTWVNFPRLGRAQGGYSVPEVFVDGRPYPLEAALDIEAEVRRAWEEREPTVILSAITRTITRIVAGEAVAAGTNAAAGRNNNGGGILGLIAGLATSAALTAADTPDTRSWSTLPARVAISRLYLPPGPTTLVVRARGMTKTYRLALTPNRARAVIATSLR